jgi:hypothetical protein
MMWLTNNYWSLKMKKKICPVHKLEKVHCIDLNPQGCISPHPNPGTHVIEMCPKCWKERQKIRRNTSFRW